MASEQFSLCWDNFHKNMSSGMQSLLESEDLVDVTLAVEGRYLKAHKMVLSVCSPYFRELFQINPCKHPIVFMKDVSYIALSDLLQFMYQGEVQVAQENLTTFIKTAEALQIKGLTGDSNSQNDVETPEPAEVEKIVVETVKRPHEVVTKPAPTARVKKPAGPASKRPRFTIPTADTKNVINPVAVSTPIATAITKSEVSSANAAPTSDEIIQFKMEPTESADQSHVEGIDDSQADRYGDESTIDDLQDDTEDYSLMDTVDDEPKAGTSADGMGDGQDLKFSIDASQFSIAGDHSGQILVKKRKARTRTRYVIGGFVYHNKLVAGKNPIRYLACAEMKRAGCRARAILPVHGSTDQLRVTQPHNHPPDENAAEREEFINHLRHAACTIPGSLKKVYDTIALLYPNGANELPFRSVCSSLHRWRRNISNSEDDESSKLEKD